MVLETRKRHTVGVPVQFTQFGAALEFERMMQPRTALFKVMVSTTTMAWDYSKNLLVNYWYSCRGPVRHRRVTPSWLINTCGTIDGTNGFGAPITVPYVAFFNYYLDANQESGQASGQASGQLPGQE